MPEVYIKINTPSKDMAVLVFRYTQATIHIPEQLHAGNPLPDKLN